MAASSFSMTTTHKLPHSLESFAAAGGGGIILSFCVKANRSLRVALLRKPRATAAGSHALRGVSGVFPLMGNASRGFLRTATAWSEGPPSTELTDEEEEKVFVSEELSEGEVLESEEMEGGIEASGQVHTEQGSESEDSYEQTASPIPAGTKLYVGNVPYDISSEELARIFEESGVVEMVEVAKTRFASNTIVLRRLVKVRQPLASMVTSQSWSLWRQSNTERATNVKQMILDDTWWERVEYLLSFIEPIMSMIRYTDTDHPCLGEVYDGIDSMLEKMKHVINEKEQDPEETFFKEVQTICLERWNKMTTPLYLLAFALTTKFYSDEILAMPSRIPPYRDAEVSEGCRKALAKLFPDREMENIVTSEFADFVASNGQSAFVVCDKYKKDAHAWWYLNGHTSPHLQTLAIKLLSQMIYDKATERSRGFAFVTMSTVEEAKAAIQKFNGSEVGGRFLRVNFPEFPRGSRRQISRPFGSNVADSPHRVYVGNLSYSTTEDTLRSTFEKVGNVLSARLIVDRETGRSQGFGFVTFSSGVSVDAAISSMDGVDLEGRSIKVKVALHRDSK